MVQDADARTASGFALGIAFPTAGADARRGRKCRARSARRPRRRALRARAPSARRLRRGACGEASGDRAITRRSNLDTILFWGERNLLAVAIGPSRHF